MQADRKTGVWVARASLLLAILALAGCSQSGGGGEPDRVPPSVGFTIPTDGAAQVPLDADVIVHFDEDVWPPSIGSRFELTAADGTPVAGTVGVVSVAATFHPSAPLAHSTRYTALVRAGVEDLARNRTTSDYSWSFTTAGPVDSTPPVILEYDPLPGALDVRLDTLILVQFSEPVDPASIDAATYFLRDEFGVDVLADLACSGNEATLTPLHPLAPARGYMATLTTGVTDLAGNPLKQESSWTFTTATPAPGSLDLGFGEAGIVRRSLSGGNDWANSVLVDPAGRILAGGITNSGYGSALLRFDPDGILDASFGVGGIQATALFVMALARQADGSIVAAGGVELGTMRFAVARYDSEGIPDSWFGTLGIAVTPVTGGDDILRAVALQPDGRIVAAGTTANGSAIVRHQTDGYLDGNFGALGIVTLPLAVSCLSLQADGGILVAGSMRLGATTHFALARFTSDGSPDPAFGSGGMVVTNVSGSSFYGDWIAGIAVQPDGRIAACGTVGGSSGYRFALARYDAAGGLDPSFGDGGLVLTAIGPGNDDARAIALQPDGKLIVAGQSMSVGIDFVLARYRPDGGLDPGFGSGGLAVLDLGNSLDEALAIARQADGRIVLAGRTYADTGYDFALARFWP